MSRRGGEPYGHRIVKRPFQRIVHGLPAQVLKAPAFAARERWRAHRLFHPLCGATLDTLTALALRGGAAPGRVHVLAIAFAMAALRSPFTAAEAAGAALIRRDYPAPIFVVGHWRSGTTHLTNLLSRSGGFGVLSPISVGLPAEALGLASAIAPLIEQFFPRTRLIDNLPLAPDLPQEDELAMANLSTLSCNHGIYFPRRLRAEFDRGVFGDGVRAREWAVWTRRLERYVAKMTWRAGGRALLIRNPANSARIPMLRAIWPEARFIHIHRSPADVYCSSVRMFTTLVRELSLDRSAADTAGLVRHVYPRLMERLIGDAAVLPAGRIATVGFDALRESPLAAIERLYEKLELPGFAAGRAPMRRYLEGLTHEPARHRLSGADAAWLEGRCAGIATALGYAGLVETKPTIGIPALSIVE